MNWNILLLIIILLPFLTFVINGLFGNKTRNAAGLLSTMAVAGSAVLSIFTAWQYFFVQQSAETGYSAIIPLSFKWLPFTDELVLNMGFYVDQLSIMMLVVITLISSLVHFFSIEYMKGDKGYARYFSFLSLFTFSMLGLVIAVNILQVYVFWELVGVSSFLLIGYFFTTPSAIAASKKAFIVTRFADFGFLIGILVMSYYAKTMDFNLLFDRFANPESPYFIQMASASFLGMSAMFWALFLVFIGGAGKSAVFPLHIWLPDAMEGPTPVSALIHAATMVVAGVFLIARLFPIYYFGEPLVLELIAYGAAFTALFAATIACVQTDIKRVLAYSTISQISYMLLALGVSGYGENGLGYTAGMAHLFTHAMFKALLFLSAGVIIHYVHTNDISKMGNLRKYLPVTHLMFLVASLAIAGIPPFAGFFSKEIILTAAFEANQPLYYIALLTAGMTAFYIFRLYFTVFWGENTVHAQHKEGGFPMLSVLILLGIFSTVAGFLPFNKLFTTNGLPIANEFHLAIAIPAVLIALAGIGVAAAIYFKPSAVAGNLAAKAGWLYRSALNKFYIDEIYLFVTRKIIFGTIANSADQFEHRIIDPAIKGSGTGTEKIAEDIKGMQSGKLQQYLLVVFFGVVFLLLAMLLMYKVY